jgi:hypothetical protein
MATNQIERIEQIIGAYPETVFPEPSKEVRKWLHKKKPGLQDCIAASMARHMIGIAIKPLFEHIQAQQAQIDRLMLEHCPGEMTEEQMENWAANQVATHCMCPACKDGVTHASDCDVHNAPALPIGTCDCGVSSQTTATQAAVAAAMRSAAEEIERKRDSYHSGINETTYTFCAKVVRNSIPAEATAALEKICMEVAELTNAEARVCNRPRNTDDLRAIVRDVLNKPANGGGK